MSLVLTAHSNEELVITIGETTFTLQAVEYRCPKRGPILRYIIKAPKIVKIERRETTN